MSMALRILLAPVFSSAVLLTGIAPVSPAVAAEPSPSAPASVRFVVGTHVGYKFDAAGNILATRSASFSRPSAAQTTRRAAIAGRGVHLYMSSGVYLGYWVKESSLVYIPGLVGDRAFATAAVPFPTGTYLGYRFTSGYSAIDTAKPRTLLTASMAHSNRSAAINGRPYVAMIDGIWAGYWMPGSAAAPTRVNCRAGNRVAAGASQILGSVATTVRKMSLTFDMGGRLDPARRILDALLIDRVCTTIFVTGDAANTATGTAVLGVVRAHPELFEVGNHTMHHCDLVHGGGAVTSYCPASRPTAAFVRSELTSAGFVIVAKTGQSPIPYWRPPYGAYDTALVAAAASAGYTKTFLWSVDTIDWKPVPDGGPNALQIATKVRGTATSGSIVLMHLGGYCTLDALPYTLAGLRARGLTPTSLSDLLH